MTPEAVALVGQVLAAESAGIPDPTGGLLSYGVLGIVVVCMLTGVLVPGWLYKRSEAENDRLRRLIDDKVYPLVESSQRTNEQATETLKELLAEMRNRPARPASRGR